MMDVERCDAALPSSLDSLVVGAAKRFGDAEFMRFTGASSLSFLDFERVSRGLSSIFLQRGVKRGDRIGLMMANSAAWPLIWFGLLRIGAIAVPINAAYRRDDFLHVMKDSKASGVVFDGDTARTATEGAYLCDLKVRQFLSSQLIDQANSGSEDVKMPNLGRETVAGLQYTSGTTGFPKACVLTHDYWLRTGHLVGEVASAGPSDIVLTAQTFSYIDPQWHVVMGLMTGATIVVMPRFSASNYWSSIRAHEVTFAYVLGTMPMLLYRQPTHSSDRRHKLRLMLCSGIPRSHHQQFEDRWGVPWREVYGMTETGIDLAVPIGATRSVGSGSVGVPVGDKEVRIVGGGGRICKSGERGELQIRGKPMMDGYFDREAETVETIGVDGWLRTGDVAYMDDSGWVYLVGRSKDMVRRGGENIACAEVEGVLAQHPLVESCAVLGVEDPIFEQEVKVFVRLVGNVDPSDVVSASILEFASERLARFKVPRFLEYVDAFPLTPSERISKPDLLSRVAPHRFGVFDRRLGTRA